MLQSIIINIVRVAPGDEYIVNFHLTSQHNRTLAAAAADIIVDFSIFVDRIRSRAFPLSPTANKVGCGCEVRMFLCHDGSGNKL